MEDNKLTHEMKRYAVIVAIHANHSDLEMFIFLNLARSFVHKVRRELEVSDDNVESVAKRKKHKARSDTVRTSQFVQQVQSIIDKDPSKSIRAISRDAAAYIAVLEAVVKPWIDSVRGERPYVFQ